MPTERTQPEAAAQERALLDIRDLRIRIAGIDVVAGASVAVRAGEVLALVGESGCGKSLTALSIVGLLPKAARVSGGQVLLDGDDLLAHDERSLQGLRGDRVSVIFQEPIASLNPLMRVGAQVEEALIIHRGLTRAQARVEAVAMLARVGIPDAALRAQQYPFELSGGMCQRVMIAAALVCRPRLLIADEPTTALDVTIQAQILALMKQLREEVGTTILLITHDMGVVADMADDVAVMYGGRVVESGPVERIFAAPAHPYTRLLLDTVPKLDGARQTQLRTIQGVVPAADAWPEGCRFRTRCPLASEQCAQTPPLAAQAFKPSLGRPEMASTPSGGLPQGRVGGHPADHRVACWHSDQVAEMAA